jgi:hypothetical protein
MMGMSGIEPPTHVGGDEMFYKNLSEWMGRLGSTIGAGIYMLVLSFLIVELVLNPVFMLAQAEKQGVNTTPIISTAWWLAWVGTLCTTGLQYALFNRPKDRPGRKAGIIVAWVIVVIDTAMDAGGFAALMQGDIMRLKGDPSQLTGGILPAGIPWPGHGDVVLWLFTVIFAAICAAHEPFLRRGLGRLAFTPDLDAGLFETNILAWTEHAGKLFNGVSQVAIIATPFLVMTFDVVLFTQSVADRGGGYVAVSFVGSGFVTGLGIFLWEYYSHLQRHPSGKYAFNKLNRTNQWMFIAAIGIVIVDSGFDLVGFNQALYGQATILPPNAGLLLPYLLTTGLILCVCTMFEPLNSDLFGPLARLARQQAKSHGGGDLGGFGDIGMGGSGGFGGSMPPMGGSGGFGGSMTPDMGGLGGPDDLSGPMPTMGGSGGFGGSMPPMGGSGGFGGSMTPMDGKRAPFGSPDDPFGGMPM